MNKNKLILATVLLCVIATPLSVFSQCLSEEMFAQKWSDFKSECALISNMVPCAVAVDDADKLPPALGRSERKARIALAQSVKTFVSYSAMDTSWMEGRVSKELSEAIGRVKIEDLLLVNSQVLKSECVILTDDEGTFHRVVTLMVLHPQYYKEAEEEIKKAEAQSSSSAAADLAATQTPKQNALPAKTSFKEKAKEIATKTAWFLLGIVRKAVGL